MDPNLGVAHRPASRRALRRRRLSGRGSSRTRRIGWLRPRVGMAGPNRLLWVLDLVTLRPSWMLGRLRLRRRFRILVRWWPAWALLRMSHRERLLPLFLLWAASAVGVARMD